MMINKVKLNAGTPLKAERPIPQSASAVNPDQARNAMRAASEWDATPEVFDERYDNVPCTD